MATVNHYGLRNKKINLEMISNEYLQCSNKEDWEHIVKCPILLEEKEHFSETYTISYKKKINKMKWNRINWILFQI